MKPFKIKTMNSIYELNEQGLWQNGNLYCKSDEIYEVYFSYGFASMGGPIREPTVGMMLFVYYGSRLIRTSPIMEVLIG